AGSRVALAPLGREALAARLPGLRPGWARGLEEPTCADIDVARLHASYLRAARADLIVDARVLAAERSGGRWSIVTAAGSFTADILVNAAGAWADPVAVLAGERPLGISPHRRT